MTTGIRLHGMLDALSIHFKLIVTPYNSRYEYQTPTSLIFPVQLNPLVVFGHLIVAILPDWTIYAACEISW